MAEKTQGAPKALPDVSELQGGVTTAPSDRNGSSLIGKVIDDRYRILSLIAQGGMGKVFQAEQSPLGRVVALKVLESGKNPETERELRQRFILEAATCSKLTHPNTIRIFDYGKTQDDVLYISMEYLQGQTLHHVIRQEAPLPLLRMIHIMKQICGSLREAHATGLIHRDLKPSNIMLLQHGDDTDFVKVLDFGLVRQLMGDAELTHAESVVGSPSYMSPEQIRGEKLDQRSDIYSLGVLMYTCLAGRTPFAAESSVKVMMAHLSQEPPPLAPICPTIVDAPFLEWVIMTCLKKEAPARFSSMEELIKALKVAERQLSGEQPPPPRLQQGRLMMPDEWLGSASITHLSASHHRSLMRVARPETVPGTTATAAAVPLVAGGLLMAGGIVGVLLVAVLWYWTRDPVAAPAPPPTAAAAPATLAPPATATLAPPATATLAPTPEAPATPAPTPAATASPAATPKAGKEQGKEQGKKDPPKTAAPTPAQTAAPTPAQTAAPTPAQTAAPATPSTPARTGGSSDLKDPWGKK